MSYTGLKLPDKIDRYLEVKPPETFSREIMKDIKMVTFFPEGLSTPFGSAIYRLQKYPGDIDLIEDFRGCSINDVAKSFAKNLKRVVNDIIKSDLHYFSEFKTGLDHRYDVDIGYLERGVYHINPHLWEETELLMAHNLLSDDDIDAINTIIHNQIYDANAFDVINKVFREHRILRWTADEILKGAKVVKGEKFDLVECLKEKTHTKIDMIALYNGNFVEITNFVVLGYINSAGKYELIGDEETGLEGEVEKLYFSNMYYSPFKVAKRIFSLARTNKYINILESIIPLVSSNISLLYQLTGEIGVILVLLERAKKIPWKQIHHQLDYMKTRFSNILQIDEANLVRIINALDNLIKDCDVEKTMIVLEDIAYHSKKLINCLTIKYFIEHGINPPPMQVLPKVLRYNYVPRLPEDNPDLTINNLIDQYGQPD